MAEDPNCEIHTSTSFGCYICVRIVANTDLF